MGKKEEQMRERIAEIIAAADVEHDAAQAALAACVDYTNKEKSEIVLYYSDGRIAAEFELPMGYMLKAVQMWAEDCKVRRQAHENIIEATQKTYQ